MSKGAGLRHLESPGDSGAQQSLGHRAGQTGGAVAGTSSQCPWGSRTRGLAGQMALWLQPELYSGYLIN